MIGQWINEGKAMQSKQYKWWQIRTVKLTRQYVAGIVVGIGAGLSIASILPDQPSYWVWGRALAFILIAIGATTAYSDQQKAESTMSGLN
jgi:F0F1-type ATP synthase assembly protein I